MTNTIRTKVTNGTGRVQALPTHGGVVDVPADGKAHDVDLRKDWVTDDRIKDFATRNVKIVVKDEKPEAATDQKKTADVR